MGRDGALYGATQAGGITSAQRPYGSARYSTDSPGYCNGSLERDGTLRLRGRCDGLKPARGSGFRILMQGAVCSGFEQTGHGDPEASSQAFQKLILGPNARSGNRWISHERHLPSKT